MNAFTLRVMRVSAGALIFCVSLAATPMLFAQHHGGHSGHMGSGHVGGAHHSTHHHSGGLGYSGFGYGGIGYGGIGYGGIGYGGIGPTGFGFGGFGANPFPYGYGYGYSSPYVAGYRYGSPYGYSSPSLRVQTYRNVVPSSMYPRASSVVVSRRNSNVWDGVSDLKPGMVLSDGAIVVSVGPTRPAGQSSSDSSGNGSQPLP